MEMKTGRVFRGALWIVGEYCLTVEDIEAAMNEIRNTLGELPLLASEQVNIITYIYFILYKDVSV